MREIFMSSQMSEKHRPNKKVIFNKSRYKNSDEKESVLYTRLLFLNYYGSLFYDANLSTTLLSLEYSS